MNTRILAANIVALSCCVLVAACAQGGGPAPAGAPPLQITVNTAGIRCTAISPEIHVANPPAGTAAYYFRLQDLDVPSWNHGGGTVPADPSGVIPAGAIHGGYNGPCPPSGTHTYKFTVQALDAAGKTLEEGSLSIPM